MVDGQIATIVTLEILPERDAEFRATMSAMIADVRANEPDTLLYFLTRDNGTCRYRMLEIYRSVDAATVHGKRESVRAKAREIGSYLAAPVTVETLEGVL